MKSFEFARLLCPEIAGRVVVNAILVRERDDLDALEGVGHHAVVRRIDQRRIHQHAAAADFLIADLRTRIGLPDHVERVLLLCEQSRAALAVRGGNFLRGVERDVDAEDVGDQAGAECDPAAAGKGLIDRSVEIGLPEFIGSTDQLQQGVAEEGRRVGGGPIVDLVHEGLRGEFLQRPRDRILVGDFDAIGRQQLGIGQRLRERGGCCDKPGADAGDGEKRRRKPATRSACRSLCLERTHACLQPLFGNRLRAVAFFRR